VDSLPRKVTDKEWSQTNIEAMKVANSKATEAGLTSCHLVLWRLDMELQDSVFSLLSFSLALIQSFLVILLFWNGNV
jgi:hypothetical protein